MGLWGPSAGDLRELVTNELGLKGCMGVPQGLRAKVWPPLPGEL